jgi:hypothetical protein
MISHFEIPDLRNREIAYACQPDASASFVDHHGALLVQSGALLDLETELQSAYMSTNQSNQL